MIRESDPQQQQNKLDFLESLRGLASLYVVIHHARWFLWEGYSKGFLKHPKDYSIIEKTVMYLSSAFIYGHEMVIFFFILSGLVVYLRYAREIASDTAGGFNWLAYFNRRVVRILPPFLFAIVFTFLLDSIGKGLQLPIYNDNTPFQIVNNTFSLKVLVGNLLFLMNTYVETWGSNYALWSLKYEWWFYMLFPFFLILNKKSIWYPVGLILILFFFSFNGLIPIKLLNEIFCYMPLWWLGTLLADIYTARIKIDFKYFMPLVFALPAVILLKSDLTQVLNDLVWGIGFVGLLSVFFYLDKRKKLYYFNRLSFLGSFSYSLYITHMPILVFISGYLLSRNQILPQQFNYVVIGCLVCVVFAFIVHFAVETPFVSSRNRIMSKKRVSEVKN